MPAGKEKHDWIEVYLNLLYENPECSILDWVDTAEKYVSIVGRIRLYSMAGNRPGICFGIKEMSALFLKDKWGGGYYTPAGDEFSVQWKDVCLRWQRLNTGLRQMVRKLLKES